MIEPTLLEKTIVNLYTPIDKIGHLIPKKSLDKLAKRYNKLPIACLQDTSKKKIRHYKLLINNLQKGNFDEKLLSPYTRNPCGRLQLHLAQQKGYFPKEEYDKLKNKYF